jgi:hypothetical protein
MVLDGTIMMMVANNTAVLIAALREVIGFEVT